ncbi:MAG: large conductance mechanosensitive channel protein MscL [Acidimicrobium sp.]|nr:large conductance mechanosensitive channel protein MscL [Ilumatobacteraceae bacterium]PHX72763.1 MAG: large conductance mechanosensitive channel protein MscL [Acidimicrobium sp.]
MSEIFTKVEGLAKRGVIVEFKEFINRGNVIDLAVAFVMGAAFKTVVDSFAGSDKGPGILGSLIGAIFGGQQPDFSKKVLTVNGSDIPLGAFATSTLNFFFVALALFMVVKLYNRFRSNEDKEKAALNTNDLLVEIRDELRASRHNEGQ